MKAYLKKNPEEKGFVTQVYKTADGQKRLVVKFAYTTVDADANDFEVLAVNRTDVLGE